jgi:hypothetical protein
VTEKGTGNCSESLVTEIQNNICGDACKQLCLYKNKIAMEHSSNLSYNDIYKLFMITVKKKKQEIGYPD